MKKALPLLVDGRQGSLMSEGENTGLIRLFSTAGIGTWDKTLLHGGTASEVFMTPWVLCPS